MQTEHTTNLATGASRLPVLDCGTTFHPGFGGRDSPSILLDNHWKLISLATEAPSDSLTYRRYINNCIYLSIYLYLPQDDECNVDGVSVRQFTADSWWIWLCRVCQSSDVRTKVQVWCHRRTTVNLHRQLVMTDWQELLLLLLLLLLLYMQRLKWSYHKNAVGSLYKQQMSHICSHSNSAQFWVQVAFFYCYWLHDCL